MPNTAGLPTRSATSARRVARQRVDRVVVDVGQNHLDHREADLVEPQQQQRVGKVHQPERDHDGRHPPIACAAAPDPGEHRAASGLLGSGVRFSRTRNTSATLSTAGITATHSSGCDLVVQQLDSRPGRAAARPPRRKCPSRGGIRTPVRARTRRCRRRAARREARRGCPCRAGRPPGPPARPAIRAAAATITLPSAAIP